MQYHVGAAATERGGAGIDAKSDGSTGAKEQGSQKQMEELVDDWIDRELTPVIQKQVSCRACSQVSICSIERRSLPAICLSGSAPSVFQHASRP